MNCTTENCPNEAREQRRKCRSCEVRAWRKAHPHKYAFDNLRTHARARGIAFCLTLAQFTAFAHDTGYLEGKGLDAESLTVDRIDFTRGYEAGNIDCCTRSYNSTKGNLERRGIPFSDALEA